MRVLVTGATGFIGKRLCDLLIKEGHIVRVITRSRTDFYDSVLCDMENDDIPSEVFDDIEVIFHLAGYAHDLSNKGDNKDKYTSLNVDVTMKLARLASLSKVRKFIYVSSVKAVNTHEIYGESKRQAEISLLELAINTAMNISVLRPSLVYGPNVKGNLQSMQSAIKRGWFPPLPKLSNCRSMIHVDDVADFYVHIVENYKSIDNGSTFKLGSGRGTTLRELSNLMESISGKKTNINWGGKPYRKSDVHYAVADTSDLRKIGWTHSIDLGSYIRDKIHN